MEATATRERIILYVISDVEEYSTGHMRIYSDIINAERAYLARWRYHYPEHSSSFHTIESADDFAYSDEWYEEDERVRVEMRAIRQDVL